MRAEWLAAAALAAVCTSCAGPRYGPDEDDPAPEPDPTSYGIKLKDMALRKHVVVPGLSEELSTSIGREVSRPPDRVGALTGYAKACAKGERAGCYMLGLLDRPLRIGDDTKREAAMEPLATACATDVPAGCHLIGLVLDDEGGNPVDPKAAYVAYAKACKLGFQPSCVREAWFHVFGQMAKEHGAADRHIALRKAACLAGFPSGCRPAIMHGYAGDNLRACQLGDLDACLSIPKGKDEKVAKRLTDELRATIGDICDASGHALACADASARSPLTQ